MYVSMHVYMCLYLDVRALPCTCMQVCMCTHSDVSGCERIVLVCVCVCVCACVRACA
jgi:hypothetical protein